jgi:hypothetical protein
VDQLLRKSAFLCHSVNNSKVQPPIDFGKNSEARKWVDAVRAGAPARWWIRPAISVRSTLQGILAYRLVHVAAFLGGAAITKSAHSLFRGEAWAAIELSNALARRRIAGHQRTHPIHRDRHQFLRLAPVV